MKGGRGGGGRTGSGRLGGENECGVYVREGGQCVVCKLCVHGWACELVGGGEVKMRNWQKC